MRVSSDRAWKIATRRLWESLVELMAALYQYFLISQGLPVRSQITGRPPAAVFRVWDIGSGRQVETVVEHRGLLTALILKSTAYETIPEDYRGGHCQCAGRRAVRSGEAHESFGRR